MAAAKFLVERKRSVLCVSSLHFQKRNARLVSSFSRRLPALPEQMGIPSEESNMDESFDMAGCTNVVSPRSASVISNKEVQGRHHKRRVSHQAGRALEILGHAIEYLTDEFVHQGGSLSAQNGQLAAIQLLMARNRAVYFSCPEIPGFGDQCRAFLRAHFHWPIFAGSGSSKR